MGQMQLVGCSLATPALTNVLLLIFSERELTLMFAICHCKSICLSVTIVTFQDSGAQATKIFRNVSTPFGTSAIH